MNDMDPQTFVDALQRVVMSGAADGELRLLADPPGRRPSPALLEASAWFRQLAPHDRMVLERIVRRVAHASLFHVLCVLDGAAQVEAADEKGTLVLQFVKRGAATRLSGHGAPLLHELLGSPEEGKQ